MQNERKHRARLGDRRSVIDRRVRKIRADRVIAFAVVADKNDLVAVVKIGVVRDQFKRVAVRSRRSDEQQAENRRRKHEPKPFLHVVPSEYKACHFSSPFAFSKYRRINFAFGLTVLKNSQKKVNQPKAACFSPVHGSSKTAKEPIISIIQQIKRIRNRCRRVFAK